MRAELDKIDHSILKILSHDGRISVTELGEKVGLSKTPVAARMRRLENEGVIIGYRAELSGQRLGIDHIAFMEIRLSDTREAALQEFNRKVRQIREVEECHMIAGGFDYLVKIRTTDIGKFRLVLSEEISNLPYIASSSTYFSIETIRDRGITAMT